MFVIATIDGFSCSPYDTTFVASDNNLTNVRTMNFLCLNVPYGNRTAKMMLRSLLGQPVAVHGRTMIVQYAK